MALYLISYDVKKQAGNDYRDLYDRLDVMKAMKVLESVWVVEAPMGQANELAGQLRDTIKGSDRLLVIEVTNDAASLNLLVKEEVFNATLVGAQLGVSL